MPSTTIDRIAGLSTAVAVKAPCRCATTANVTLEGLQTVDGVVLVANDRVLVKNQSASSENGIYVASSSAWTRALDFDGRRDAVTGTLVYVNAGSANSDSFWHVSTAGDPNPGDAMAFARSNMSLAGVSSYFQGLVGLTNGDALLGQLISDMGAADVRTAAGLVIGTNVLAPNGSGAALTGILKQGLMSVWIPADAWKPRITNGAARGTVETPSQMVVLSTLDFDQATPEFVQFPIRMPKGWNASTLTYAVRWSHAATTVNFKVAWALQILALSDDDAQDTAFGTAVQVNDTGGTTNDSYETPVSGAVTASNTPAKGDELVLQISRVAGDVTNDTLAIDARLEGVILFFTVDAADDS